jgi:hypothetical protein
MVFTTPVVNEEETRTRWGLIVNTGTSKRSDVGRPPKKDIEFFGWPAGSSQGGPESAAGKSLENLAKVRFVVAGVSDRPPGEGEGNSRLGPGHAVPFVGWRRGGEAERALGAAAFQVLPNDRPPQGIAPLAAFRGRDLPADMLGSAAGGCVAPAAFEGSPRDAA